MAGYSSITLSKKLRIKNGFTMRVINAPDYYFDLFTDLPDNIKVMSDKKIKKNFIHYFATQLKDLEHDIFLLKNEIVDNGIIWISWYKKSSKMATDVTEDLIRKLVLANGLVDIKVCAIDEMWSGLKLVIPVKSRK